MDNIELSLYRIMMGFFSCNILGQEYKVIHPTPEILHKAEQASLRFKADALYEGWNTDRINMYFLIQNGFVDKAIDSNMKAISTRIDDLKVELYDHAFKATGKDKIRKTLTMVKAKSEDMWTTRHMFDHTTLNGYVNLMKHQFIISHTLCYPDGTSVYNGDFNLSEFVIIDKVIQEVYRNVITETQFRHMAKHEPWRSIWASNKSDPFGKPPILLTTEQKQLIMISRMYDSVSEHPECPPEEIIDDDDMFDGWMIKQRRNREHDQDVNTMDDILGGRHKDAHEVFIPAKTKEDAKKIEALNDVEGKIVKAQRAQFLKAKKGQKIDQSKLPDERRNMSMEAARKHAETVKGQK